MSSNLRYLAIIWNLEKLHISFEYHTVFKVVNCCDLCCVSLMKMSPLTAVLKCPHYEKGHFKHESEGEAEAPSFTDGFRW